MISQLDHMVMEGGKGDGMYKAGFPQSFYFDIVLHCIWQPMVLDSESEKNYKLDRSIKKTLIRLNSYVRNVLV